jgi:tetratricopeptide (TPR) repeat protein
MAERKKRIDAMRKVHGRLSEMEAEREEKEARAHSDTGDTFTQQNDYKSAIKEYTKAIKLKGAAVYYANRGNCYFKKKSWAKALAYHCEALHRDSQNKTYQDLVAVCQEKMTSSKLWLAAIGLSGHVFKYTPEILKTADFYSAAVINDGRSLEYVPEALKTLELCRAAVEHNGHALEYVSLNLRAQEMSKAFHFT